MPSIVVVGLQWGDEGKGKIVDWLSENADTVVRFQGGSNAGHTIVIEGKVYKLSLLPSSVLRPGKQSIIGNGVVLDPYALVREIEKLQESNIELTPENLSLSETCPLVLSVHRETEVILENLRGVHAIGTTCMGIGPCYEDKIGRRAIRLCDLLDEKSLREKVEFLLSYHNLLRKATNKDELQSEKVMEEILFIAPKVLPFMKHVGGMIYEQLAEGKTVLFEGAQGALLDIDHGTYPYVTSSNTLAGCVPIGCGVGSPGSIRVLGLAKAYTTRVGNGPFITELTGDLDDLMVERGREFGTVSKRRRRCGWFDAALVRHAALLSGATELALTKLDVLDTLSEIKICVGYKHGESFYNYLPPASHIQGALEPIYEVLPGWQSSTLGAVSKNDLPANALAYVQRIEELVQIPVSLVSTSPDRDHIVFLGDSSSIAKSY
ncbi:adenylosuccinate synthase [Anaplasma phagocytophilum]|uniref:Adenylosuccinate synthetase n=8 Tax=Anaplasma phagocytophilum TaxID=948 RepID=Q2GL07_ANAPZ|nr:adenylosuccinate synthase [Anaplasma phagocytophilum]KJV64519.1 adenylosuccinate synthase [Anaplasma phagocytophilum str. ApMUC09]KJV67910.1 adenylosuccinate synthase [Anaplasma phagocytophilum str. ApNP]KJZ99544.1 adenylosuccinate synthase [Anaplasma phagocytophilum str. CR1007]ABD43362.1 adenylosuccinate synthetase [Anaplasma phagocytophilum str. HZ]AGR78738.1 adenylosuccinate synthetase [Anaplasma phagocytophilum str. HZ2]